MFLADLKSEIFLSLKAKSGAIFSFLNIFFEPFPKLNGSLSMSGIFRLKKQTAALSSRRLECVETLYTCVC